MASHLDICPEFVHAQYSAVGIGVFKIQKKNAEFESSKEPIGDGYLLENDLANHWSNLQKLLTYWSLKRGQTADYSTFIIKCYLENS